MDAVEAPLDTVAAVRDVNSGLIGNYNVAGQCLGV